MAYLILCKRELSKRPASWVAWGIRERTDCEYDHVELHYKGRSISSRFQTRGASNTSVKDFYLSRNDTTYKKIWIDDDEVSDGAIDATTDVSYDIPSILYQLVGWTSMLKVNPTARMTCSERVAFILGLPKSYTYTPKSLLEVYDQNPLASK